MKILIFCAALFQISSCLQEDLQKWLDFVSDRRSECPLHRNDEISRDDAKVILKVIDCNEAGAKVAYELKVILSRSETLCLGELRVVVVETSV